MVIFKSSSRSSVKVKIFAALLAMAFGLVVGAISANSVDERRIQISLAVFPRIIAVDNNFREKLSVNNTVQLIFVYEHDKNKALQQIDTLNKKITNVAGLPFSASALSSDELTDGNVTTPTAIYFAEQLSDKRFEAVMDYATKAGRIVFSPYLGDVERGATAGIAITSRVKPYFNMQTLERSQVEINALLMQMSKRYD
jgi:hypothetical protein